MTEGILVSPLG